MYAGSWNLNDTVTFTVTTHAATGALTDADAVPDYRVYENETGAAILTGNMAKLDDANTTGHYSEQIWIGSAIGFEQGKCYNIYITATVGGITGATTRTFQIRAAVHAAATWRLKGTDFIDPGHTFGDPVTDTSFVVDAGASFVIGDLTRGASSSEIMLVTNVVGNTLTVTRGAEGTTAEALTAGQVLSIYRALAVIDSYSAAGVRAAVGLAAANLDSQLAPIPTISADVAGLDGAAMRGTDSAMLASSYTAPDNTSIAAILIDTNELQTDWTNGGRLDLILDLIAADVVNIDGAAIPSLAAILAGITTDHGGGLYTRNTEPPSLAAILAGITSDHGTGSYVDTGAWASTADVNAARDAILTHGQAGPWTSGVSAPIDPQDMADALLLAPTGGSGTAANDSAYQKLNAIKAASDMFTTNEIELVSPVSFDGQSMTLRQGEAYLHALNNAIRFDVSHPAFSAAMLTDGTTVTLKLAQRFASTDAIEISGTVDSVDGDVASVSFEVPYLTSSELVAGDNAYRFDLDFEMEGAVSQTVTPVIDGQVNVKADI